MQNFNLLMQNFKTSIRTSNLSVKTSIVADRHYYIRLAIGLKIWLGFANQW